MRALCKSNMTHPHTLLTSLKLQAITAPPELDPIPSPEPAPEPDPEPIPSPEPDLVPELDPVPAPS